MHSSSSGLDNTLQCWQLNSNTISFQGVCNIQWEKTALERGSVVALHLLLQHILTTNCIYFGGETHIRQANLMNCSWFTWKSSYCNNFTADVDKKWYLCTYPHLQSLQTQWQVDHFHRYMWQTQSRNRLVQVWDHLECDHQTLWTQRSWVVCLIQLVVCMWAHSWGLLHFGVPVMVVPMTVSVTWNWQTGQPDLEFDHWSWRKGWEASANSIWRLRYYLLLLQHADIQWS